MPIRYELFINHKIGKVVGPMFPVIYELATMLPMAA
jgi:hypothetical protein